MESNFISLSFPAESVFILFGLYHNLMGMSIAAGKSVVKKVIVNRNKILTKEETRGIIEGRDEHKATMSGIVLCNAITMIL